ncbi:ABC transporter ATP-binding protein [Shinella sumterensis]|uniref:ATP-binding cassette domain-containing protein n=1 Tax=Shinella sumterensis TaxID=1967501 RepID=A0AA50H8R6_9HYPH|nr:ATP-binding cassette domain-containing protein [Shinella sumterensis]WLS00669.1 ATP-binding cassette domain-containing protein [Shinella sumterensis]
MLELKTVKKHFGALKVIDGVDLTVHRGEVVGILGPNGAGKSTLFNLISGNLKPTGGQIFFKNNDVTTANPWTRTRAGIGRTFQIPKPFGNLSVFENVLVGATQGGGMTISAGRPVANRLLDLCRLSHRATTPAGALPLLDLKRLELAKALALNPALLLLDEIAGGLTDQECGALLEIIMEIQAQDVTIVWIEHVVHALMRVASRLVVLAEGRLIADGAPADVMNDNLVRDLYLGALE